MSMLGLNEEGHSPKKLRHRKAKGTPSIEEVREWVTEKAPKRYVSILLEGLDALARHQRQTPVGGFVPVASPTRVAKARQAVVDKHWLNWKIEGPLGAVNPGNVTVEDGLALMPGARTLLVKERDKQVRDRDRFSNVAELNAGYRDACSDRIRILDKRARVLDNYERQLKKAKAAGFMGKMKDWKPK